MTQENYVGYLVKLAEQAKEFNVRCSVHEAVDILGKFFKFLAKQGQSRDVSLRNKIVESGYITQLFNLVRDSHRALLNALKVHDKSKTDLEEKQALVSANSSFLEENSRLRERIVKAQAESEYFIEDSARLIELFGQFDVRRRSDLDLFKGEFGAGFGAMEKVMTYHTQRLSKLCEEVSNIRSDLLEIKVRDDRIILRLDDIKTQVGVDSNKLEKIGEHVVQLEESISSKIDIGFEAIKTFTGLDFGSIHKSITGLQSLMAEDGDFLKASDFEVKLNDFGGLLSKELGTGLREIAAQLERVRVDGANVRDSGPLADKSYSTVVMDPVVSSLKKNDGHTLLITFINRESAPTDFGMLKKLIFDGVSLWDSPICINGLRSIRLGMAVDFGREADLDSFSERLKELSFYGDLRVRRILKRKPRFIIRNVDGFDNLDVVSKDIIYRNGDLKLDGLSPVFKMRGQRPLLNHFVFSCPPLEYHRIMEKGFLYVGYQKLKIVEFVDVRQCLRCGKLDHYQRECPAGVGKICYCCGESLVEGHNCVSGCKNCIEANKRFGANYETSHSMRDPNCSLYKRALNLAKKNIDYGR